MLIRVFWTTLFLSLVGSIIPSQALCVKLELHWKQIATQCFQQYVKLGNEFNADLADLYSPKAMIKNTRIYPDGTEKISRLPAEEYKTLIRNSVMLAKERKDLNEFTGTQYSLEKNRVSIKTKRYSVLKKYTSPLILLIGIEANERCIIFEELSVSKP